MRELMQSINDTGRSVSWSVENWINNGKFTVEYSAAIFKNNSVKIDVMFTSDNIEELEAKVAFWWAQRS